MEYWRIGPLGDRVQLGFDGFHLVQEDDGREVFATTNTAVPMGAPVVYVPESLILSSNEAIEELRHHGMEEAQKYLASVGAESQRRHYYLMLKILQEIQKGSGSNWHPWLDSLPRCFTNAVSVADFCLLCLPPLMKKLAKEERHVFRWIRSRRCHSCKTKSRKIQVWSSGRIRLFVHVLRRRRMGKKSG